MTLQDEFAFYKENQDELVSRFNGKVVVIKNLRVIDTFDTEMAAVIQTRKKHERGTFLVQRVSPGKEAYTATFHSPGVTV